MNFKERYQYNPKLDLLGKGGFAIVYKANDTLLGRVVALKFFTNTADDKHTLIKEISRAISLEHPNLCRYYDAALLESSNLHGETDKTEVGVMEYLDGGDLKSYCLAHSQEQIKLLTDVLKGLVYLHAKGIIHRDLKPANILIKKTAQRPVAKITDFGISKDVGGNHTNSSLLMGTIEYMAPEQFSPLKYGIDGRIGTNLDLWSFGLMVYELVTGESLFGSRGGNSSAEQVMGNILNDDLIEDKIARLPAPYLSVVKRCLVKDAKLRVQSADELIALMGDNLNPILADRVQETLIIPKAITIDHTSETMVLSKGKATEAVAPSGIPVKKSKTKRISIALFLLLATVIAGLWYLKQYKEKVHVSSPIFNVKIYPLMDKATAKWGYVDDKGKMVIPFKYDWADSMFNGMARIALNHKFAYLDNSGKQITAFKYSFAGRFSKNLADVKINNELSGFIDKSGKEIIPVKYWSVKMLSDDLFGVKLNDKWGIFNKNGKEVMPLKYDEILNFTSVNAERSIVILLDQSNYSLDGGNDKCDQIGAVKLDGKWCFAYYTIKKNELQEGDNNGVAASIFFEGLAQIKENGLTGFIDQTGAKIIASKYEAAEDFSEGMAAVTSNGKYGFIDHKGKVVIPLMFQAASSFSDGLASVKLNGSYLFIDKKGSPYTMGQRYFNMDSFSEGLASVTNQNDKCGYIDRDGKEVVACKYNLAFPFKNGLACVQRDGFSGYIEKTGKEL